jgi:hypothetical protein
MMKVERPPPLSSLTEEQLRARAAEYRHMAETARAVGLREALLRLAEQFEFLANRKA